MPARAGTDAGVAAANMDTLVPASQSRTFRNEMWRAVPSGVLETLSTTFGMLIAVRVFHMGDLAKSIFLSATSGGMVTSLFVVPLLLRFKSTIARTAARVQMLGGAFFTLAAVAPHSSTLFIIGLSTGLFCMSMQIPLLTQIYRLNYAEAVRGRLFAVTGTLRSAAAAGFGLFGGWLLGADLDHYFWLLWAFAVACFASGWLTYGLPTTAWDVPEESQSSLWSSWRWVKADRDFRMLLTSWMIMGVGNLVAASLFVEYLANPRHGIGLPEQTIAWLTGVVPVILRVLCTYPWGLIYDRVNFFVVRSSLNVIFGLSVLCFYVGNGITWWTVAMALWGVANAGGNVAWSLWVTKLAPPQAVAEYMSVHSFLTGLRGLLAPYLAFALLDVWSFPTLGAVCCVSILSASGFITVRARSSDPTTSSRLLPGLRETQPSQGPSQAKERL